MHIAIDVAQAPNGSAMVWLGSPNGSPTRRSAPVARTAAAHTSAATPAATGAGALTGTSLPSGARVVPVRIWVSVVDRVVVIGISSVCRTASRCVHPQVERAHHQI